MSEPALSNSARAVLDEHLPLDGFSVRTGGAFKSEGIITWRDLATKFEQEVLRIPNIGWKSVKEMKDALAKHNLSFGMKLPPLALSVVTEDPEDALLDIPGEPATIAVVYSVEEINFDRVFRSLVALLKDSSNQAQNLAVSFGAIRVTDKPGTARFDVFGYANSLSFARYVYEMLDGKEPSLELRVQTNSRDDTTYDSRDDTSTKKAILMCSRDGKSGTLTIQVPVTAVT